VRRRKGGGEVALFKMVGEGEGEEDREREKRRGRGR